MERLGLEVAVNLDQLHKVLADFSEATGLATVAVDTRGVPVTPACAFTDFCRMMRSDPRRDKLCHGCDAHGGLQSLIEGSPQAYRCHSGLIDFSVPVTDGDRYLGAILCGQVRVPESEQPDYLTSRTSWQGEERLLELYEQVPTSNLRRIAAAAKTLLGLSMGIEGVQTSKRGHAPKTAAQPKLPLLTLVPYHRPETPEEPAEEATSSVLAGGSTLRDAMDAEDLATAFSEVSRVLNDAYARPGDIRDRVAAFEDVVLDVTRDCAPRLVPHLSHVVQRQRERRTVSPDRYRTQLYFERLLGMVLDEIVGSRPHRRRDLRDLLNDIARHPNRGLSLTEAAATAHWSPGHLSKLFKSVTGYTFVSYVTAWRISRAQLMLASTQTPVRKIAAELDFNQVNYFSRVFRAHTGMSPSEYRCKFSARDGRPTGVSLPTHHIPLLRA